MSLSAKDEALTTAIGQILVSEIDRATKPLLARIEALERRGYKGVYQRACRYLAGDQVTDGGGLYTAITDIAPGQKPGSVDGWQLSVKRGNA